MFTGGFRENPIQIYQQAEGGAPDIEVAAPPAEFDGEEAGKLAAALADYRRRHPAEAVAHDHVRGDPVGGQHLGHRGVGGEHGQHGGHGRRQ